MAKKKAKKVSQGQKKKDMIELNQAKPRAEEEQYLFQFSTNHHNAVLLIVLCATFIVQGVLRYLETMDKLDFIKPWFMIVILSLLFLITSVSLVILSGVLAPLKFKRETSLLSFIFFSIGSLLFFSSLVFLLFII